MNLEPLWSISRCSFISLSDDGFQRTLVLFELLFVHRLPRRSSFPSSNDMEQLRKKPDVPSFRPASERVHRGSPGVAVRACRATAHQPQEAQHNSVASCAERTCRSDDRT